MKKNDLINEFINSNQKLFSLVGPNNSGKSYFLKYDLYDNPNLQSIMYLDENGIYSIKGNRAKVKIVEIDKKMYYRYIDDSRRGSYEERAPQLVEIDKSSLNIIERAQSIFDRTNIPNKSLGTSKIHLISQSLLEYNLNEITYFIFDEPENALDDERMKYLERLFKILVNNGKKLFFVTHSPRFLELLQVDIDCLYILPGINKPFIHFNKNDIYILFDDVANEITNRLNLNNNINDIAKLDFKSGTSLSRIQIDLFLKSYDFYKVLFYLKVCIVEGDTEDYSLKCLNDGISSNKTIYKARGKYYIPFLANLFASFGVSVNCIIDSDIKANKDKNLSNELTEYLCSKSDIYNCKALTGDLENYLSIDFDTSIKKLIGEEVLQSNRQYKKFKNDHKALVTYFEIMADPIKKAKLLELVEDKEVKVSNKFANIFEIKE